MTKMLNFSLDLLVLLASIQLFSCSGKFEIELERLINRKGLTSNGTCCHGPNRFITCLQPCQTFVRFCLRNTNANLDNIPRPLQIKSDECTYGFDETPILGGNSIDFTRATQQANIIVLPFKFSWMGDFVLHIDLFNDQTYDNQPFPGSQRELILSTTIRSSIWPNASWQHSQTIDSSSNSHEFSFRYRVSCSTNFYGSQCSRFCSPLSSRSRCDPSTGDILCQQGWTGSDCNQAICRHGCQHGQCENQPGQCLCHPGWTGDTCQTSLCTKAERLSALPNGKYRCENVLCPKCENGGKCLGSKCQCPKGFQGPRCQERVCSNGGLSSAGKCLCPPNYHGEQCEIESKCPMCRNNGRCEEKKCVCTKEFIGQYCEINIRLIQKKERSLLSVEFVIVLLFILLFVVILLVLSCLFYKSSVRRQKQLEQLKGINLEKVWTIGAGSSNIYEHEKSAPKEKVTEKKDINAKLKQSDVQASLV